MPLSVSLLSTHCCKMGQGTEVHAILSLVFFGIFSRIYFYFYFRNVPLVPLICFIFILLLLGIYFYHVIFIFILKIFGCSFLLYIFFLFMVGVCTRLFKSGWGMYPLFQWKFFTKNVFVCTLFFLIYILRWYYYYFIRRLITISNF